jgi:SPP1 family predicted phage head-tail adaptor
MRAGKLNKRLTLEWLTNTGRSDSGEPVSAWVPGDTVWGSLDQLRGRLLFAADQANSQTTATIRIRYRDDVASATGKTLRISDGSFLYRIEGRPIAIAGKQAELEIMVHEWS